MTREEVDADIAELEALAAKCEQETQVYLGFRNVERAASIRRVVSQLRESLEREAKDADRLDLLQAVGRVEAEHFCWGADFPGDLRTTIDEAARTEDYQICPCGHLWNAHAEAAWNYACCIQGCSCKSFGASLPRTTGAPNDG
jgi:hypothetical protein